MNFGAIEPSGLCIIQTSIINHSGVGGENDASFEPLCKEYQWGCRIVFNKTALSMLELLKKTSLFCCRSNVSECDNRLD